MHSNPQLSGFITDVLGNADWITDLSQLKELENHLNDETLTRFIDVKKAKKKELADYIQTKEYETVDPDSIFDIHIKRLHEYKRQLMLALYIQDLYNRIKENPDGDWTKRTFFFGAKSAPGYYMAKAIIKFINEVADKVNKDGDVNPFIKVIFVTNYGVSYAEKLFPAADVSEQISMAGKEASGTGNMKFMINGAVTVGTLDGANVEIVEEAGRENNYIFGLEADEAVEIKKNYDPKRVAVETEGLQRAVDSLVDGTYHDNNTGMFKDIYDSLMTSDEYLVLKDFAHYREVQDQIAEDFKDEKAFYKKGFMNTVNSGKFSSDRTIEEYATEIWNINPIQ